MAHCCRTLVAVGSQPPASQPPEGGQVRVSSRSPLGSWSAQPCPGQFDLQESLFLKAMIQGEPCRWCHDERSALLSQVDLLGNLVDLVDHAVQDACSHGQGRGSSSRGRGGTRLQ